MGKWKDSRLFDLALSIGITVVLAVILLPMFSKDMRDLRGRGCQANMRQIGRALSLYLSDWGQTYPTNRALQVYGGGIQPAIALSDPGRLDSRTLKLIPFQNGVNWVEALYPYIGEASATDMPNVWRCPEAGREKVGSPNAAVTYALNANLIELSEETLSNKDRLMMLREMDTPHDAVLRPVNLRWRSGPVVCDPFLDEFELGEKAPRHELHKGGSHILYADGHCTPLALSDSGRRPQKAPKVILAP